MRKLCFKPLFRVLASPSRAFLRVDSTPISGYFLPKIEFTNMYLYTIRINQFLKAEVDSHFLMNFFLLGIFCLKSQFCQGSYLIFNLELMESRIFDFSCRIRSSEGLLLTDIAHQNLAISFFFLIAGHMYRRPTGHWSWSKISYRSS